MSFNNRSKILCLFVTFQVSSAHNIIIDNCICPIQLIWNKSMQGDQKLSGPVFIPNIIWVTNVYIFGAETVTLYNRTTDG